MDAGNKHLALTHGSLTVIFHKTQDDTYTGYVHEKKTWFVKNNAKYCPGILHAFILQEIAKDGTKNAGLPPRTYSITDREEAAAAALVG